jgi:hypothetical protein
MTRARLLVALMSPFVVALESSAADEPCKACARGEVIAVFTGQYVNGLPVYRLPPISVVASRRTQIAKAGRDTRPSASGALRGRRG